MRPTVPFPDQVEHVDVAALVALGDRDDQRRFDSVIRRRAQSSPASIRLAS
jgi:hypothetical protein